jgi:hypothetical protein
MARLGNHKLISGKPHIDRVEQADDRTTTRGTPDLKVVDDEPTEQQELGGTTGQQPAKAEGRRQQNRK